MSTSGLSLKQLNRYFGNLDLSLLDQILKGRFSQDMRLLDVGCGEGRNLMYFLHSGFEVHGVDRSPDAIRMMQFVARLHSPGYPEQRFQVGEGQALPYPDAHFDAVLSSGVLHFAESEEEFWAMMAELDRVLAPGGLLYIYVASDAGLRLDVREVAKGKYQLPDGSVRFLLREPLWDKALARFAWNPVEPLKVLSEGGKMGFAAAILQKEKPDPKGQAS